MKERPSALPLDCLDHILKRLSATQVAACAAVSSDWRASIQASPGLWQTLYNGRYGGGPGGTQNPPRRGMADPPDWKACLVDKEHRKSLLLGDYQLRTLEGHSKRVNACAIDLDIVASASSDTTVRLWSLSSSRCLSTLQAPNRSPVVDLQLDQHKVAAAAGADVVLWKRLSEPGQCRLLRILGGHGQRVRAISFDDTDLAAACQDGTLRLYDLFSGSITSILRPHSSAALTTVALNVEYDLLLTGSSDGSLCLSAASSGERSANLLPQHPAQEVTCAHLDAPRSMVFAATPRGLTCWDVRYAKPLWSRTDARAVSSVHRPQYSSSLVVSANLAGEIQILDAGNGRTLRSLTGKSSAQLEKVGDTLSTLSSEGKVDRGERGLRGSETSSASTAQLSFPRKRPREAWVDASHSGGDEAKKGLGDGAGVGRTAPLLCVRAGMTKIVGAHTDHTLTAYDFNHGQG
ncbi:hypothetical protein KFL_001890020 [Klebsormidium nitens]|uniref:F-box domain-containing protein n=1 Tax=Klebsormidium nitens TaxID=105231 RepID=A0A1Y1I8L3_KLENI|nr:hypothetical protein KFL_001890020 [Klebsormidium nitens]|eukprot:GAQ84438.1 hypothetical protein KFL_001890020 [Klebsormidium nitens]